MKPKNTLLHKKKSPTDDRHSPSSIPSLINPSSLTPLPGHSVISSTAPNQKRLTIHDNFTPKQPLISADKFDHCITYIRGS